MIIKNIHLLCHKHLHALIILTSTDQSLQLRI